MNEKANDIESKSLENKTKQINDIRDELSYDEEEKVRLAVARGWGTGKRTLERMCRDDESLNVRLTARTTVITWFKPPYHC